MNRPRRTRSTNLRRADGFSMMELMIVMVVVTILAMIVLLRSGDSRGRAENVAIKSDLQHAMQAELSYYADQNAYVAFATGPGGAVTTPEFRASPGVSITATIAGSQLTIVGSHPSATTDWCLSSDSGGVVEGNTC